MARRPLSGPACGRRPRHLVAGPSLRNGGASVGPAGSGNGADVLALLAAEAPDADFAADVRAARDAVTSESPVWPARLILDTGILIASERRRTGLTDLITDDADLAIAAITVAELRTGVELAADAHRDRRSRFLRQVLEILPVEPYDVPTAEAHGRLLAHVHREGTRWGAHDLIIAATAVATRRTVLTTDRTARFDDLPGVDCVIVS